MNNEQKPTAFYSPSQEGTGSGLKGMTIDLSGSTIEGNGMSVRASKGKTKQIVVVKDPSGGECTISPVTVKGEVLITESPSVADERPPIGDTSKVKVKQPKNLLKKNRHPLLGSSPI